MTQAIVQQNVAAPVLCSVSVVNEAERTEGLKIWP